MAQENNYIELQEKLGYKFNKSSYLNCALIHSSYANEQRNKGYEIESNERLEFLGDAVLQTVISEYLFENYKKRREGSLTKMRQQLVCEKMLSKIAAEINLGDYLFLGHGEEAKGCRQNPKILADAFEALIAALYLDIGSEATKVKKIIIGLFKDKISDVANSQATDYKSMLQQLAEQEGTVELKYTVEQMGDASKPSFCATAYINNNAVGVGIASKKKEAEMIAAGKALELFGILE